ncbi:oxidoreductase [Helicobacter mastomyrinus]|uniref:Oxidoreductase n=1 Tax=Helicobacter mastomyrinus TaxID=287948 RepID=A0ABZ3F6T4_9HELI
MVKDNKINLGIIGLSEGNGHPYSFSAIINGYDKTAMKQSGWDVIYNYLLKCDEQDFLNREDVAITHLYTQDSLLSSQLSSACNIPHITHSLVELAQSPIDGVILARDDWQSHLNFAKIFLESNKFVFIDKPLSLNADDIAYFSPFLANAKLMSCSGMRYARELDDIRKAIKEDNHKVHFIEASIGSAWDRYLIHLLDAIMGIIHFEALHIEVIRLEYCISVLIQTKDFMIQLNNRQVSFQPCTLHIITDKNHYNITLSDNFSAFRRTMGHFVDFIQGKYYFDFHSTLESMRILSRIHTLLNMQDSKTYKASNVSGGGDNTLILKPFIFPFIPNYPLNSLIYPSPTSCMEVA